MKSIMDEITKSEKKHRGEIRFAVEASLDIPVLLAGQTARDRAIDVFSQLRVWDTEENTGILVYLLMSEHDIEIIADRGINKAVGPGVWDKVCFDMEKLFREGQFEEGVKNGIRDITVLLEKHFPHNGDDINELPDRPVIL